MLVGDDSLPLAFLPSRLRIFADFATRKSRLRTFFLFFSDNSENIYSKSYSFFRVATVVNPLQNVCNLKHRTSKGMCMRKTASILVASAVLLALSGCQSTASTANTANQTPAAATAQSADHYFTQLADRAWEYNQGQYLIARDDSGR